MRERRRADDDQQDDDTEEWEVWKPPQFPLGGLIGSNVPSKTEAPSSYKVRKQQRSASRVRWTSQKDD